MTDTPGMSKARSPLRSFPERVEDLARLALKLRGQDYPDALAEFFELVIQQPEVARHVFAPHASAVLGPILRRISAEADGRPGQRASGVHHVDARSATNSPQGDSRSGRTFCVAQSQIVRPAANPARIPAASIGKAVAALLLDEVMPNGKRFRDCTKTELEEIGRRDGRRSHRCLSVAAQLTAPSMTPADAGITEAELRRVDAAWNGE